MAGGVYTCGVCFQAEDGIRDLVRSRGLGDVYKRQGEKAIGFEFLRIEFRADGVFYVAQPGGRPKTEFKLSLIHI